VHAVLNDIVVVERGADCHPVHPHLLAFDHFPYPFHPLPSFIMATYHNSSPLPRPPPSYEHEPAASGSTDPLLGEDRGRHSDDDIPDDFKYILLLWDLLSRSGMA